MIGRREFLQASAVGALTAPGLLRAAQADGAVITNPIEVADGRVLLAATIGTRGPYRFVLDTGGQFGIIDVELAKTLALKRISGRTLRSVGGSHDQPWYRVEGMAFTNGRLPPLTFISLDRGLGRGRGIAGSVGAALFTSNDTDIDFGKRALRIYGGGKPDRAGWTKLPSRFILEAFGPPLIAVEVGLDQYRAELVADTGTAGSITLDASASKASGLWDDARPYAPTGVRGIGVALARRRIVRAGRLTIGPFTFDRPLVALSPPDTGEEYRYTGMIGLGILSQLNLSSDVAGRALWAQPSGVSDPIRSSYSLSGLWLSERGGRVVVDDVGTGSPAKAAGVVAGDRVVGQTLDQAIDAITGRPGQEVAIRIERAGNPREVKFTLAEYL